jgi:hypothetical protein
LTSAFVVICVENCIKSMLSKNWKPILSMDIIILSACSECVFILIACSACVNDPSACSEYSEIILSACSAWA